MKLGIKTLKLNTKWLEKKLIMKKKKKIAVDSRHMLTCDHFPAYIFMNLIKFSVFFFVLTQF